MVEDTFFDATEEIITAIQHEIKNYENAVRSNKKLSELKKINLRIKELVSKLKDLYPNV